MGDDAGAAAAAPIAGAVRRCLCPIRDGSTAQPEPARRLRHAGTPQTAPQQCASRKAERKEGFLWQDSRIYLSK